MHLYIITRGIKHEIDKFITELQGKYLPFKFREKDGQPLADYLVQVSVRPIQLWEIGYPEEQQNIIYNTILDEKQGAPNLEKYKKHVWAIKKALGLKDIPKYEKGPGMPISKQGLEIVGIGIKPDYWITKDGKHVDKKEEGAFEGL